MAPKQTELKPLSTATVGDMIDPATLPADVLARGGGWIGDRYVCDGCHKDGQIGWKLTEISSGRYW